MTATKNETTENNTRSKAENELPEVYIDDVLMSLKYYIDERESHIRLSAPEVCMKCESKGCLYFCPVGAYREDESGKIQLAHQSCIECGSCRVMCPYANIEWKLPRGGFGVAYKFG